MLAQEMTTTSPVMLDLPLRSHVHVHVHLHLHLLLLLLLDKAVPIAQLH